MKQKEDIINHILKLEGGYVNDPSDSGGETNMGITNARWLEYNKAVGYKKFVPIKHIDKSHAIKFYNWYLRRIFEVDIDKKMLAVIADGYVHSRTIAYYIANTSTLNYVIKKSSKKDVSRISLADKKKFVTGKKLHVKLLGEISKTKEAVDEWNDMFLRNRKNHFNYLVEKRPKDAKFLKGWMTRVDQTAKFIEAWK